MSGTNPFPWPLFEIVNGQTIEGIGVLGVPPPAPAATADATAQLAILAEQTGPGAGPLHARLAAALINATNDGDTNKATQICLEVNRYLANPV
jgi:hypothetical protein